MTRNKMIVAGAAAALLVGGVAVAQTNQNTMNPNMQAQTTAQGQNTTAQPYNQATQNQSDYGATMRAGERG